METNYKSVKLCLGNFQSEASQKKYKLENRIVKCLGCQKISETYIYR